MPGGMTSSWFSAQEDGAGIECDCGWRLLLRVIDFISNAAETPQRILVGSSNLPFAKLWRVDRRVDWRELTT